jgi:hypothetical protein
LPGVSTYRTVQNCEATSDFRGPDTGDFVYHCHIAEHEDDGMMAIIRVKKSNVAAVIERMRLYFASLGQSLGLLHGPDLAETEKTYAWCRARRTGWRSTARQENNINNRYLARRDVR